jgi:hypothetical protein
MQFLRSHVTSYALEPNILRTNLLPNVLSWFSSFRTGDIVIVKFLNRSVKLTIHLHLVPRSEWNYTSTPQYAFMAWCLVKHRDNFTFFTFTSHS